MATPKEIIADWLLDGSRGDKPFPGSEYAAEIIAALEAGGYVIVPKEPTEEMRAEGLKENVVNGFNYSADGIWRKMIAAFRRAK